MRAHQLVTCVALLAAAVAAVASALPDNGAQEGRGAGTAGDLLLGVYRGCVSEGDFSCVKPKLLAFLSASVAQDKLRISRDLAVVRRADAADAGARQAPLPPLDAAAALESAEGRRLLLERLDDFLSTHELRVRVPKELAAPAAPSLVPAFLLNNLPEEIRLPLVADERQDGRGRRGGMLRKVVIPFLLGLKFKVSALMPLALALIALKTWKALTLGLLSIVLSAAMVIFKITKPKVLNYEIVHLPHPAPVIEHPAVAHYEHHPHHPYAARSLPPYAAHPVAYSAYYDRQSDQQQ